jgi:predicted transposase/invertase (TIGR01784 family)
LECIVVMSGLETLEVYTSSTSREMNTLKKIRADGLTQGREEGREERNIEIAKKMLIKKHAIADISDITGLSTVEIEKLKP